ncbi:MAG: DUF882 domain-containing protein [Desulfosarcinaceae bacterium]|nr:DUF882 domain-containing protein [Desulfosarcinaceae bacterium]
MAAALPALLLSPRLALAYPIPRLPEKRLALFNPKAEELLETTFWVDGAYRPSALTKINHLMRDLRSGKSRSMDTRLIELLWAIQERLRLSEPIHIISGFRSRETNEHLRKQGWAAAKNSFHIHGKAVDIRLGGGATAKLRKAAYQLKQGGIGYYPRLNFVHLDMGPVRYWRKE